MSNSSIICTVDVVLLTLKGGALHVALVRRDREPFANTLALPGGYIQADADQDAQDAAVRVLKQKTGIEPPYLEQLATFTGPTRDPRGWSVSVVYYALVSEEHLASQMNADVSLVPVAGLRSLPFDHLQVVHKAVSRVSDKSSYSSLPAFLCPPEFTLPQLQAVYEALLGEPLNKVSFRRKVDEMGVLEAIPNAMETGKANRPAQLYRLKREFRQSLSLLNRGLGGGA